MSVAEFIEYLKAQPQDAIVQVLCRVPGRGYEGDTVKWRDFKPEEHGYMIDLTNCDFQTPERRLRYLELGED
jgi:hypothetical protein